MGRTYKIGLIGALVYIAFELAIVATGYNHNESAHVIAFAVNTLCLLLAIAYSILSEFNRLKSNGVSLLHDIKSGLRTTSIYALTVAVFIFSYYKWIDPEYPKLRAEQHLARVKAEQFEETAKIKMQEAPEMYEGKSIEDLRDTNEDAIKMILDPSPVKIFPITLFSLVMLGMVYTFMITGFNRLVLAKLF